MTAMFRMFHTILFAPFRFLSFLVKWILKLPVLFYRKVISPQKGGSCCRYTPSCSAYALEAIDLWGIFSPFLILWRILRCNPFSRGGYDPVPLPPWKRKQP